ncbi:MFS transporter [Acidithiobacillus caldus]|nr:MFS transporter [Acidithiobacillus caldus]
MISRLVDLHQKRQGPQPIRRALWSAMLGMGLDGYDLSIMAVALLSLTPSWGLSPWETGVVMAMPLLGSFFGALLGGAVIDRWGRRRLLLPNVVLYALGAGLSAISPNLLVLSVARFIVGLGIGLDYPLVSTLVAEYRRTADRGQGFVWINLAWESGALLSSLVGWWFFDFGPDAWRWMLGSAVIPAVLLLQVRRKLPESPRWLARHARLEAADRALRLLRPEWQHSERMTALGLYAGQCRHWSDLLRKQWHRRLFLGVLPWFFLDVVGLGVALYFPTVLRSEGLATTDAQAAVINAIFIGLSMAGMALILPRIDRVGRVRLQWMGFFAMAFGLITLSLALLSHRSWAVFLGAGVYCLGIGMGPGVTVFALAVELFPTDLRGSASGLAAAVARIGALLSAVGFPLMEAGITIPGVLAILAVCAIAAAWVTWHYQLETKGLSLEYLETSTKP